MKKLTRDNQEQKKTQKKRSSFHYTGVNLNRNETHTKTFRKTQKALKKV